MKTEVKSEKTARGKIIFIIILAVVFVLVAYFRFFHNKSIRATNLPVAAPPAAAAPAQPAGLVADKIKEAPGGAPVSGMPARNIFAPTGGASTALAGEKAERKALPVFRLSGVITDQGAAIAVINGKFLKAGEAIEGYQVVSIGAKTVTLSGNGDKIVLNVLTSANK